MVEQYGQKISQYITSPKFINIFDKKSKRCFEINIIFITNIYLI